MNVLKQKNERQLGRLKGVLFDFDGTLTKPGLLDFKAVKSEIQCPADSTILEYIGSLRDAAEREKRREILEKYEREAALKSEPNTDAEEIVLFLESLGLALGIITRNSLASVREALSKFQRLEETTFKAIIARDEPIPPKPDPAGVLLAAKRMVVPVESVMLVGDYVYDIEAGRRAGAVTVFLNNGSEAPCQKLADHKIGRLGELRKIIMENR